MEPPITPNMYATKTADKFASQGSVGGGYMSTDPAEMGKTMGFPPIQNATQESFNLPSLNNTLKRENKVAHLNYTNYTSDHRIDMPP